MSEFAEFVVTLITVSCAFSVGLLWLALLAGWTVAGEDPGNEETDDD